MKTVIEMAREAGLHIATDVNWMPIIGLKCAEKFADLVRADERNSWPLEMEAMERQVNILTDALAQRTWVGLTDEEREIASWTDGSFGAGARWADAKLKEKNT